MYGIKIVVIATVSGQARPIYLFFPVRAHVDVATTRAALRAHDLAGKGRHVNIVGILRHVDQPLVSARIADARGD